MSDARRGYTVIVPCSHRPGTYHVHPIGEVDPKEIVCTHIFTNDFARDMIVCAGCGLRVTGQQLDALKYETRHYLSERERKLSDENGRLADENREVLAENARLRRQLEARGRKP